MTAINPDLPHIYLKQGQASIREHPAVVTTILGSCVAVTLYNRRTGIAAICHSLLPHCRTHSYIDTIDDLLTDECYKCREAYRYVDCAVSMMVEAFTRFGIKRSETQVHLFGGARMIATKKRAITPPVGHLNTAAAQKVLADCGLTVHAGDVGGAQGRKLFFNTQTGEVILQKFKALSAFKLPFIEHLKRDADDVLQKENPRTGR